MKRPMTATPLVSVIVPNYNYDRTLALCLNSLRAQSYSPLEIICVDDCSTDDSVATAKRLGVRVIRLPSNGGVSVARNVGAAHARGQVLFFVDSDVALEPDAVANAVAVLGAEHRVAAVCGTYEPEPLIRDSLVEEYRSFQQYYMLNSSVGPVHENVHTAILAIRAEVFAEIGGFSPRLRHLQGIEFTHRLLRRHGARLTSAVRGRHDNDDTLRLVLRKVFIRTRMQLSYSLRFRATAKVAGRGSPARGMLFAGLALAASAAPLLLGPAWILLPAVLLALSLTSEGDMYRAAVRHRGVMFGAYFAAVHFLVNLTIGVAVAAGLVQWTISKNYRGLHDPITAPPATR